MVLKRGTTGCKRKRNREQNNNKIKNYQLFLQPKPLFNKFDKKNLTRCRQFTLNRHFFAPSPHKSSLEQKTTLKHNQNTQSTLCFDPIQTRPKTRTHKASVASKAHSRCGVELRQLLAAFPTQNHTKPTPECPRNHPQSNRFKHDEN